MAALFVDAWSMLFMFSMERRAFSPAGRTGRPSPH
jgi:hypothetical protein